MNTFLKIVLSITVHVIAEVYLGAWFWWPLLDLALKADLAWELAVGAVALEQKILALVNRGIALVKRLKK